MINVSYQVYATLERRLPSMNVKVPEISNRIIKAMENPIPVTKFRIHQKISTHPKKQT